MGKRLLLDLNFVELQELVGTFDQPVYRARQLLEWIYTKHATSFDQFTNLPKTWREQLQNAVNLTPFSNVSVQHSVDGTRKYLFTLHDQALIESVCIPMKEHFTLCISSQVGCSVNCVFCLTGQQGFTRQLTSGEILGQVLAVQQDLPSEERISNIVFMGMGEPLLNYQATVKAIHMMLAEEGLNFSNRKITVSTAGIIPAVQRLGQEDFTINLAVSLNAATDEIRSRLMPVNRTYPLAQLLDACRVYPLAERRRITFEYILLDGMNDTPDHAKILTRILQGIRCKINLIPYNATPNSPYHPSPEEHILTFKNVLSQHGYSAFIRASKGADISAACGQLRGQAFISSL